MRKNTFMGMIAWIGAPLAAYLLTTDAVLFLLGDYLGMTNASVLQGAGSIAGILILSLLFRKDLKLRGEREKEGAALFPAILGAAVFSRAVNQILALTPLPTLFPGYTEANQAIYENPFVIEFLLAAVLAPILEEILLRGLVYGRMRAFSGIAGAAVVSSLIFAVFHGNVVQGIYAFFMGCFLCLVYEKSGSLRLAILAHGAANAISLVAAETKILDFLYLDTWIYLAATAVCVLVSIWSVRKLLL